MVMIDTAEAEPQFAQPVRQITLMLLVIILVSAGSYLLFEQLKPVLNANPFLNGLILAVFVVGLLATFWQVVQLIISVNWIEGFVIDAPGQVDARAPRLLAPLAALMRSRGKRVQISQTSARSILDSVATRIEEARDITRYIVSLLIFLGLLGTFYGLATTVPAVVDTIRSLAPQEGEAQAAVFGRLMQGLEAQLGGMGTAFASSLLGLAGSLVVGLLELFASHGQNRFYRELEEWLSSITRLGLASGGDGENAGDAGNAVALIDYMAQQMDTLTQAMARTDRNRAASDAQIGALIASVGQLTHRLEQGESQTAQALMHVAQGLEQQAARPAQDVSSGGDGADPESRMHLRSIDVHLLRILEEMSAGRPETVGELRQDISKLTREIRRSRNAQQGAADTGEE
jgi:hypothetical protein